MDHDEGGSPTPSFDEGNRLVVQVWVEKHFADLNSLSLQPYDGDLESPNDMMVDPEDFAAEKSEDVAIINPEQLSNDVDIDMEEKLRADNCALHVCPSITFTMR